ncbi:hypothetical protein D3C75_601500 [compost metagenome]
MQHFVSRFHVLFQNAVKLESLTVGQTNAAVNGFIFGKFINRTPLFGGNNPARQTAAQHHGVAWLKLLLRTFCTNIAVILLIHTVETNEQEVVASEAAGQPVLQIFFDGAAQIIAFAFQALGITQFAFDH